MEFKKYRLVKKWWQVTNYKVYDEANKFVCEVKERGIINNRITLYNVSGEPFLVMKPQGIASINYDFWEGDNLVGSVRRNWSSNKFTISYHDGPPVVLKFDFWNKKLVITAQGVQVGLGSCDSFYCKIGLAINEKLDPTLILATTVLIGSFKAKGMA